MVEGFEDMRGKPVSALLHFMGVRDKCEAKFHGCLQCVSAGRNALEDILRWLARASSVRARLQRSYDQSKS